MKKSLLAILLVMCILLTGCGNLFDTLLGKQPYTFQEFIYTRPEIKSFDDIIDQCSRYIKDGKPIANIVICINKFYDAYDAFYTNLNLADIHYYCDMTDTYWETESNYCAQLSNEVEMKLEELFRMLAHSDYREELEGEEYFGEGYFESYLGEQTWDEDYMKLAEQEVELQTRYQELCAEVSMEDYYTDAFYEEYGTKMAQVLVDLIRVRQQMAAELGYHNYAEYAYYGIYDRDYTPERAKYYLRALGKELSPIYKKMFYDPAWEYAAEPCTQEEAFAYVERAAKAMGGMVYDAFCEMRDRQLYDITYSENKYPGAYTVFLGSYWVPFIYMAPSRIMTDKLDFTHEFGHFANDYISGGSWVGIDVAEIQSQGMEYMSLYYADDPKMTDYKMLDSLSVYVEQAAYALFELEIYELTGEDLTVENVKAIHQRICEDFGMAQGKWDPMSFVTIGHFYLNPMYVISYVVSNDLALQFYQLEQEQPGQGQGKFNQALESQDYYITDFVTAYGLKDPFGAGRAEQVRQFFETEFMILQEAA